MPQTQTPPRHTHRHRRVRRRSWSRTFLVVLAFLLLVAVVLVGAYRLLVRRPDLDTPDPTASASAQSQESASSETPVSTLQRKDGFYNILLSGVDDGNGGSDTNILIGFDSAGGSIRGVSVPRDTGVWYEGKARKVNFSSKHGVDALADTLSDTLGIPVDFTVQVDLRGFEALVNAIDGVDFNVPINMDYDDPLQDLSIHFQAGMQHLNGADALKVVRFRQNNDGSGYGTQDIGRIATQQAFLKTVAKKMLANPGKIGEYVQIFTEHVDTDLELGELAWLGEQAVRMGLDSISFDTLPGAWSDKRSLYLLDGEAVLSLVNEALNPYELDRTAGDLNLVS